MLSWMERGQVQADELLGLSWMEFHKWLGEKTVVRFMLCINGIRFYILFLYVLRTVHAGI